ncbi:MAG: hypothetical protein ABI743_12935, partial [bacterium]
GWPLLNPPALIRWNFDKGYLQELAELGIPTIPTVWLRAGERVELARIQDAKGWPELVIKPRLSAGARGLWSVQGRVTPDDQTRLDDQLATHDLLVQPLLRAVEKGERSLTFFRHAGRAGQFSHALLKRPAPGDIRIQFHYGGTFAPIAPSEDDLATAAIALGAIEHDWLYARVDGLVEDGVFYLIEFELFEPVLYLQTDTHSVERFADAIQSRVGG